MLNCVFLKLDEIGASKSHFVPGYPETREKPAILTVQDHVIGISKEDHQRIFKYNERAASVKDYK